MNEDSSGILKFLLHIIFYYLLGLSVLDIVIVLEKVVDVPPNESITLLSYLFLNFTPLCSLIQLRLFWDGLKLLSICKIKLLQCLICYQLLNLMCDPCYASDEAVNQFCLLTTMVGMHIQEAQTPVEIITIIIEVPYRSVTTITLTKYNCTGASLKEKIYEKTGIPPWNQRLIFMGMNIQDTEQLSQMGMENNSNVRLYHPTRGGSGGSTGQKSGGSDSKAGDSKAKNENNTKKTVVTKVTTKIIYVKVIHYTIQQIRLMTYFELTQLLLRYGAADPVEDHPRLSGCRAQIEQEIKYRKREYNGGARNKFVQDMGAEVDSDSRLKGTQTLEPFEVPLSSSTPATSSKTSTSRPSSNRKKSVDLNDSFNLSDLDKTLEDDRSKDKSDRHSSSNRGRKKSIDDVLSPAERQPTPAKITRKSSTTSRKASVNSKAIVVTPKSSSYDSNNPLKKAIKLYEEVDDKLKLFLGQDLKILRRGDRDTNGKVIQVYKVGQQVMMKLEFVNDEGETKKREQSLDALMLLNPEAFEGYQEQLPASQNLDESVNESIYYEDLSTAPPPKKRNDTENMPSNVRVYPPDYTFIQDYAKTKGTYTDYLILFADDEKKSCYKYSDNGRGVYNCIGCTSLPHNTRITISAKIESESGKEYLRLLRTNHHCDPLSFDEILEKAGRVVRKPDYEIIESTNGKKHLFWYTNMDEVACVCEGYKYVYDKTQDCYMCRRINACQSRAKEITKDDGETIIKLFVEHKCEPRQFKEYIVRQPNFVKKADKNHIFVFLNDGTTMGYNYYYQTSNMSYRCPNCNKFNRHYVSAKLIEDPEGDYLKLSKTNHICKPIQYVPELDQLEFPPLECLANDEGKDESEALKTRLETRHPDTSNQVTAVTYAVTLKGPESPLEERFSALPYIGYSEFIQLRLGWHEQKKNSVVAKLIKKYGVVYLVPIYESISARCHDLEAAAIELQRRGSLPFPLLNKLKGDWKCTQLKEICEDNTHPDHATIALGLKKLIFDAMKNSESFISFRDLAE